jgi:hypothetical protein
MGWHPDSAWPDGLLQAYNSPLIDKGKNATVIVVVLYKVIGLLPDQNKCFFAG